MSERTQEVFRNGIESDWINSKRGVPQGTNLGILLFNFYVNDLAKVVEKDWTVVQYADDTFFLHPTLMKYRRKQNLNITSQNLSFFFAKFQLVVNKQKTEYIVFSTRKRVTNMSMNVDNER